MDNKEYPVFRYNPNAYVNGIIEKGKAVCQCCGKSVEKYISNMYTMEEVDCICVFCVADGSAADKFDGTFIQNADPIDNKEATKELFCRTPGYWSWQGENWVACCDDYAEFIDRVGTKELEEIGIADDMFLEDGSFEEFNNARDLLEKDGNLQGYLFRCIHCRKYYMRVDSI